MDATSAFDGFDRAEGSHHRQVRAPRSIAGGLAEEPGFWAWRLEAACGGLPSSVFFSPDGERGAARRRVGPCEPGPTRRAGFGRPGRAGRLRGPTGSCWWIAQQAGDRLRWRPLLTRAAQVAPPTSPSGARPWVRWKRRTVASVMGPKAPSTARQAPAARRRLWTAATPALHCPWRTTPSIRGDDGAGRTPWRIRPGRQIEAIRIGTERLAASTMRPPPRYMPTWSMVLGLAGLRA